MTTVAPVIPSHTDQRNLLWTAMICGIFYSFVLFWPVYNQPFPVLSTPVGFLLQNDIMYHTTVSTAADGNYLDALAYAPNLGAKVETLPTEDLYRYGKGYIRFPLSVTYYLPSVDGFLLFENTANMWFPVDKIMQWTMLGWCFVGVVVIGMLHFTKPSDNAKPSVLSNMRTLTACNFLRMIITALEFSTLCVVVGINNVSTLIVLAMAAAYMDWGAYVATFCFFRAHDGSHKDVHILSRVTRSVSLIVFLSIAGFFIYMGYRVANYGIVVDLPATGQWAEWMSGVHPTYESVFFVYAGLKWFFPLLFNLVNATDMLNDFVCQHYDKLFWIDVAFAFVGTNVIYWGVFAVLPAYAKCATASNDAGFFVTAAC